MPALPDDNAFDNAGFENKMLKDTVEVKAGESLISIEVDFGSKDLDKLNSDMTENVESHFLHLINASRCKFVINKDI